MASTYADRRTLSVLSEEVPAVKVNHSRLKDWSLAESDNFRVFHNQDTTYAEMVVRGSDSLPEEFDKRGVRDRYERVLAALES